MSKIRGILKSTLRGYCEDMCDFVKG